MDQEQEIAGHTSAAEAGSYFLTVYYNILTNQPHLANQFYTDNSSVMRLDCETGQGSFGESLDDINEMMMSMNVQKVEVKTANFLESWGAAIALLVTGLVQLKGNPVRKRFAQSILLAPKKDGYYVFSDIFNLICDEYNDHQYRDADYNCVDNVPQVDAPCMMAETATDCLAGEHEATEIVAPVENQEAHQQAPLENSAEIYDDTPLEEHNLLFPSSTDTKQDSPDAPPQAPSPPILEKEPAEEAPKTYASVLRKKGNNSHQAIQFTPANKVTTGSVESQQSVPLHEKSNFDTHRVASVPEDEEEFLSVYVRNLSPSTSVFDLEKVLKTFGRIKPDGVAIRSRKEAGVFFGFVEFEDHSGINNALNASPIWLNGREVHIEERRPNCGFPSARRGRGRDQVGGRYDEYATRSKGNGQKRGGRQYDSYY